MSELILRIGIVSEGPRDYDVIGAAVEALLGETQPFIINRIHPLISLATRASGDPSRPVGWGGVYRWCRDVVDRAGRLSAGEFFDNNDLLVLHLDADVAESNYPAAHINDAPVPTDLPCVQPCPPPAATTDALRAVLLRWAGETVAPARVVLCTPSKSSDAWVLAALYPTDNTVQSGNLECHPSPETPLGTKPAAERLISSGKKNPARYQARVPDMTAAWPAVCAVCTEAERFSVDFVAAAGATVR